MICALVAYRKFTRLLHVTSMLLVAIFGAGIDQVDLDKSDVYWDIAEKLLKQLLLHAGYASSANSRAMHNDVGLQAACFAGLCVWHARNELKQCAEQVCICSAFTPTVMELARKLLEVTLHLVHNYLIGPRPDNLGACV
jgi:hypothetical protein